MDTREELLARTSNAAACINKREDQTRQITRDFHIRVANCAEVEGRIFGHLL